MPRARIDLARLLLPLLISATATGVAMLVQNVMRSTWQVRTLPERVMEWLLLFVPLDVFERGLAQFGASAKSLALIGTTVGMVGLLIAVGALAVARAPSSWYLLKLGGALWLATMVVVLPITGAGVFGTALLVSPWLTSASFAAVFLTYAWALIAGRLLTQQPPMRESVMLGERRALIVGLVGAVAAGGLTRLIGPAGVVVSSDLPLAAIALPLPVAAAEQATPPPSAGGPAADPTPGPTTVPQPQAAAATTPEPYPNPPPARQLARNKDGALTAAGRPRGELAPRLTSNEDFYVVTKNALADPILEASTWRLIIDGEVNRPAQIDYRTLRALPATEVIKTLECISNFTAACAQTAFGCDLISTARWKGARLSDVLALAGGLKPTAQELAFISVDEFSAGLPVEVVEDPQTLLVYEMNGAPLPREHGFPVRLLVPGRYGMKNPKWLASIRATEGQFAGWYEQRNWNKDGIIKTMARIDTPIDGAQLALGEQRVAGIAYAGTRGLRSVEFSTDEGDTWLPTRFLEPMPGKDAMVRWEGTFGLQAGESLSITVRATDGTGEMQTELFQLPQPDGASGRDSISVAAA